MEGANLATVSDPLLTTGGCSISQFEGINPPEHSRRGPTYHRHDSPLVMPTHSAAATWNGLLMDGDGEVTLDSGVWSGTFATPDVANATDPEELLAAAQASCFAMTASYVFEQAGYSPERFSTRSIVTLTQEENGFSIPSIEIEVSGHVPEASAKEFSAMVREAEHACPVAHALNGKEIAVSVVSES